jgi:putative ribosome biogenesis GTPase RsgA
VFNLTRLLQNDKYLTKFLQEGVGKSSLINRIFKVEMAVSGELLTIASLLM